MERKKKEKRKSSSPVILLPGKELNLRDGDWISNIWEPAADLRAPTSDLYPYVFV